MQNPESAAPETPTAAAASTTLPAIADRKHIRTLDGLRGIAILLVIGHHFCLAPSRQHPFNPILQLMQLGWAGVDLFFVLSGFLITSILLETREHARYYRNFLARRFLRIWPLYYFSLVWLLVVLPRLVPALPPQMTSMIDKQAWFWLYASNWLFAREGGFHVTAGGWLWSLGVEEQFYLVWPIIVRLLSRRAFLRLLAALFLISLGGRAILAALGTRPEVLCNITFTHMDGLVVGAFIAAIAQKPARLAWLRRRTPLAILACVGVLVASRFIDGNLFLDSQSSAAYGYSVLAILFGALLLEALSCAPGSPLARILSSAPLTVAGKYSYALYLIHLPVAIVAFPIAGGMLAARLPGLGEGALFTLSCVIVFALCLLGATVSWYVFEKPLLSLKRYFAYG